MSSDKLVPCAPDLGRRLDEAVEFVGLEAACSKGEQRRTYTWLSELMKEARQAISTNAKATAWAEGYRWGVLDERTSAANIGIAGFNAKVEPARQNPYGVAPALAAHEAEKQAGPVACVTRSSALRAMNHLSLYNGPGRLAEAAAMLAAAPPSPLTEQAGPVAGQVVYLHRLSKFEGGKWVPATELIAGEPAPEWAELAASKPDLWRVDRRVTGVEIARGLVRAVQASATDTTPPSPLSEQDKEDAENYRWLLTQFRAMSLDMGGNHCWVLARSGSLRGPTIDDAIRAARAKKEQS